MEYNKKISSFNNGFKSLIVFSYLFVIIISISFPSIIFSQTAESNRALKVMLWAQKYNNRNEYKYEYDGSGVNLNSKELSSVKQYSNNAITEFLYQDGECITRIEYKLNNNFDVTSSKSFTTESRLKEYLDKILKEFLPDSYFYYQYEKSNLIKKEIKNESGELLSQSDYVYDGKNNLIKSFYKDYKGKLIVTTGKNEEVTSKDTLRKELITKTIYKFGNKNYLNSNDYTILDEELEYDFEDNFISRTTYLYDINNCLIAKIEYDKYDTPIKKYEYKYF